MILTDLKISFLRNIHSSHVSLNPGFNFIIGPNGSGKTSILEALYLLSCGHSFRSREISPIITNGQSTMTIFAKALNHDTVSIQKSYSEPTQIKLNNQYCTSTSQLAYALPCQVFYSDIFQIIDAGPSVRRSVLDWGLFHVKHNYLPLWKEFKRVLKQRNTLLKTRAPYAHFIPWDNQLSSLADQLNILREDYFTQWQNAFTKVLKELTDIDCSIKYYKGWDRKNTGALLKEILADSFEQDNQRLYTQYGPHQADIIIESSKAKAKHILSRGQQKIILFALKLAQSELLQQDCLYLIDDFSAELDDLHQKKLLMYLNNSKGQYIITSTHLHHLNYLALLNDYRLFRIDNAQVTIEDIN
jgi:DNA replication and repair protein RecF